MTTPVYVTHGRKYHTDSKCPAMLGGELLHDWEGDIDYGGGFTAGTYRRVEPNPQYAAMCGKLPCLRCVPVEERVFPPLHGQTFGHEPVDEYEGTTEGDLGVTHIVCARCVEWARFTEDIWIGIRVPWPCTSAIVLGLEPRPDEPWRLRVL